MAQDYRYTHGRQGDEERDAAEGYTTGYQSGYGGAEDGDPEYKDATFDPTDHPLNDTLQLTEPVDEPVDEVLDDPAVGESPEHGRFRRLKGPRRPRGWVPPDLREYGLPVFWPVNDPRKARRPGPGESPVLPRIWDLQNVLHQILMTPLASCSELARVLALDESLVTGALEELEREGLLRKVSFGCLLPRTDRHWVDPVNFDGAPVEEAERAVLTWHRNEGVGCLLRWDMPRVESINQVAAMYAVNGWALERIAWVDWEAVHAVARYHRRGSPEDRSTVAFMWVGQWDSELETWARLGDLPEAVGRITPLGMAGSVALVGADRWAVARALPMAVERLKDAGVRPGNIAAWTHVHGRGWQAASGASMLDGAGRPFSPTLAPVQLGRFVQPRARRRLGRTTIEGIIAECPWTRRDGPTLYQYFNQVAEHTGASIAQHSALRGKSRKDRSAWKAFGDLLRLGLILEVGSFGRANLPAHERSQLLSLRGQGRMRYRVSLVRKTETLLAQLAKKLAEGQDEESTRELAKKLGDLASLARLTVGQPENSGKQDNRPAANGAFQLMLNHGRLSLGVIVRRSGLVRLADRLGDRRIHDDILVDLLGCFCLLGCEVAPTSRALTVNLKGIWIASDGVVYCSSPAGNGHHRLELELSHLGPKKIRTRLEKYGQQFISYPLLVVCATDLGARHYDGIGQELGVAVVATSIPRLHEKGFSGPAWFHQGREVYVTPVPCPPEPAADPDSAPAG